MPEKTIAFNVRHVPVGVAKKIMALAKKYGSRRENYIRRLLELHVEQAERAEKRPGAQTFEAPTHAEVAAALEAERVATEVVLEDALEQVEA